MRSFLLGAPVEGSFNIPFKVEKSPSWVNPYVTDGLVCYWDGEWNAGGGKHDAGAEVWKDLSGNGYDAVSSGISQISFLDDEVSFSIPNQWDKYSMSAAVDDDIINSIRTIECVYKSDNTPSYFLPICFYGVTNRHFILANVDSKIPAQNGYSQYGASVTSSSTKSYYSNILTGGWPLLSASYQNGVSLDISQYASIVTRLNQEVGVLKIACNMAGATSGAISAIRVYSRALTASEIVANYTVDKARFNLS